MPNPLGGIFPDEIVSARHRRRLSSYDSGPAGDAHISRILLFIFVLIFGLGVLLARLITLSVIEGDRYRELSQGNRIKETKITADRGIIYDRNGNPLVRNIPVFIYSQNRKYFETRPATVSGNFTESVVRQYVYGESLSHLLGYTSEVNADELKHQKSLKGDAGDIQEGDMIGQMGVESEYDSLLRGVSGRELSEVDATGRQVRLLGRKEPLPGENLKLALDLPIQQIAAAELKGKKGAVIATVPSTGEILAMYSAPSFDPNAFVRGTGLDQIFADPGQPLFNRSIGGTYPPGSTFKIVTAISALETGAITRDTQFEDTGTISIGAFSFGNWYFLEYGKKEGTLNITGAIRRSNDIFFYKTGEAEGITNLANWAKKIGLGSTLGIDIEGEAPGLVPDPVWREKTFGTKWYLGDTYHVSIGQGDLLVTPLQVNAWTNIIANDGSYCKPHVLLNGKKECKSFGIKDENIALIREGMKEACSTGGTGWPFFNFKVLSSKITPDNTDFFQTEEATTSGKPYVSIPVACKTGTAEFGEATGRTHGWFTVFAPVVHPQIAVTVLVEGEGEGSNVAAPVAKKMLEEWFGNKK